MGPADIKWAETDWATQSGINKGRWLQLSSPAFVFTQYRTSDARHRTLDSRHAPHTKRHQHLLVIVYLAFLGTSRHLSGKHNHLCYLLLAINKHVPHTHSTSTSLHLSPIAFHSGTASTNSSNMASTTSPSPPSDLLFLPPLSALQLLNELNVLAYPSY